MEGGYRDEGYAGAKCGERFAAPSLESDPAQLKYVVGVVVTMAQRENEETTSVRDEGSNRELRESERIYLHEGRNRVVRTYEEI